MWRKRFCLLRVCVLVCVSTWIFHLLNPDFVCFFHIFGLFLVFALFHSIFFAFPLLKRFCWTSPSFVLEEAFWLMLDTVFALFHSIFFAFATSIRISRVGVPRGWGWGWGSTPTLTPGCGVGVGLAPTPEPGVGVGVEPQPQPRRPELGLGLAPTTTRGWGWVQPNPNLGLWLG